VVILPDTHPLAAEAPAPISLKELVGEPLILFPRRVGPVLYDQIINLCLQTGFSPNVVQEVVPQQTILGLVSGGIGISLIHASIQALGGPGVIVRHLVEPSPQLELAVAWSPDATNPVLSSFIEIVREVAVQHRGQPSCSKGRFHA